MRTITFILEFARRYQLNYEKELFELKLKKKSN